MDPQRCVDVLGRRAGGESADRVERGPPEDGAASAKERRIEPVLRRLDVLVEHRLLVPQRPERQLPELDAALEVVEDLGRLHKRQLRVREKAQRALDEPRLGNVIAIEEDDELGVGVGEAVIHVASLGVEVVVAGEVQGADPVGQGADRVPCAVVEDVDPANASDPQRAQRRHLDDVARFVVGGNEGIHRSAGGRRRPDWMQEAAGDDEVQDGGEDAVNFEDEERRRQPQELSGGDVDPPGDVGHGGDQVDRQQRRVPPRSRFLGERCRFVTHGDSRFSSAGVGGRRQRISERLDFRSSHTPRPCRQPQASRAPWPRLRPHSHLTYCALIAAQFVGKPVGKWLLRVRNVDVNRSWRRLLRSTARRLEPGKTSGRVSPMARPNPRRDSTGTAFRSRKGSDAHENVTHRHRADRWRR